MKLQLIALEISNFKGIQFKTIAFDGHDATISGRNASGKTTIYDAFLWLLFGKDSTGAADFAFKPLDESGAEIHNLDTGVRAIITVDGAEHTLTRISSEKWTRPRGQAEHVFGGDTQTYEIDGVPRSQKEFKAWVDGMIPEAQFRLITSYTAFMALKTNERRAALIGMSGADVDKQLAAQFSEAFAALEGLSADDARIKLRKQRQAVQKELDAIPARVDELNRTMAGANEADRAQLEIEAAALTREIGSLAEQLATDPLAQDRARLRDVEREIATTKAVKDGEHRRITEDARLRLVRANRALGDANAAVESADKAAGVANEDVDRLTAKDKDLLTQYNEEYAKQYKPSGINAVCPACGQALPLDQIEAARKKDEGDWHSAKANALYGIDADGRANAKKLAAAQESLSAARAKLLTARDTMNAAVTEQEAAEAALKVATETPVDYGAEYANLLTEREELKTKLARPVDEATATMRNRKADCEAALGGKNRALAAIDQARNAKDRIAELTARQRELGDQLAAIDRRMMLIEDYVRARCRMLEDGINALFLSVRWRLFRPLDNGGIEDCCDCMIPSDGGAYVPYFSANNGARINAGLEIINALCAAGGVSAPVMVDNAESVNHIIPTAGQQIRLEVTDGPLVVAVHKKEEAA